jgi:hypothetical protein
MDLMRSNAQQGSIARDQLPFTGKRGGGWWCVKPSGDFQRDYATGREYALQFWIVCGKHGNMGLDLSSILIGIHGAKRPRRRYPSGKLVDHNLSGVEDSRTGARQADAKKLVDYLGFRSGRRCVRRASYGSRAVIGQP